MAGARPDSIEGERLFETTHAKNYSAYGYRRTWKALLRAGEQVPRCTVQRLMRTAGIQGAKRRGKPWRTTKADPDAHRSPDLVRRDFTAQGPNQLWVADMTYVHSWQGLSFLAFVIDVFGRRVVGWQLAFPHAHDTRPRCAADGARDPRPGSRRRSRPPLRSRLPTRTQPVLATVWS